jgi:hypothetical protein
MDPPSTVARVMCLAESLHRSWFLVTIVAFRASAVFVWRLQSIYISESETHGICRRVSQSQSSTRKCPWQYQSKVAAIIGASPLQVEGSCHIGRSVCQVLTISLLCTLNLGVFGAISQNDFRL